MTSFWKNLHQLALGQLFNGGHLSAGNALAQANRTAPAAAAKKTRQDDPNRGLRHVQIAALR